MSDLISRQDAIECCSCLHPEDCWAEINALPSADAVQGEWVRDKETEKDNQLIYHKVWTCPFCGEQQVSPKPSNFCHNCGARLYKGGDDKKVKTEMSLPKWIPCSERLPENGHYYLWCSDMGSVQCDYYWKGFENGTKYGYNIIAWMPLPEPYEGSESDEID